MPCLRCNVTLRRCVLNSCRSGSRWSARRLLSVRASRWGRSLAWTMKARAGRRMGVRMGVTRRPYAHWLFAISKTRVILLPQSLSHVRRSLGAECSRRCQATLRRQRRYVRYSSDMRNPRLRMPLLSSRHEEELVLSAFKRLLKREERVCLANFIRWTQDRIRLKPWRA